MSGLEQVTEWQVLPAGMADDDINAHSFAVTVKWRGPFNGKSGGGWGITHSHAAATGRSSSPGRPLRTSTCGDPSGISYCTVGDCRERQLG